MAADGLLHGNLESTPEQPWFLTDVERQAFEFGENNLAIQSLTDEMKARAESRQRQLEAWQAQGIAVLLKGWARDYTEPASSQKDGSLEKQRYSNGGSHDEVGGWTPPDRYIVDEIHQDAVEGTMVWIRPALGPDGLRYDVLARTLVWIDDATIIKRSQETE